MVDKRGVLQLIGQRFYRLTPHPPTPFVKFRVGTSAGREVSYRMRSWAEALRTQSGSPSVCGSGCAVSFWECGEVCFGAGTCRRSQEVGSPYQTPFPFLPFWSGPSIVPYTGSTCRAGVLGGGVTREGEMSVILKDPQGIGGMFV